MTENTVNISGNEAGSVTEGLPKGFTYFARDGDLIKIGSSMKPDARIAGLQRQMGRELEVLAIVSMDVADEFETHQKFVHLRVHGEWFRAEDDLIKFIEEIRAHHISVGEAELEPEPIIVRRKPGPTHMAKRLTALRIEHGAKTPIGYRCTNLLEALPAYQNSTDNGQKEILARNIRRWTSDLAGMVKAA